MGRGHALAQAQQIDLDAVRGSLEVYLVSGVRIFAVAIEYDAEMALLNEICMQWKTKCGVAV